MKTFAGSLLYIGLFAGRLAATTYTVTNTADSGTGSLRQAITDANGNPGADMIVFNIPGSDTGCDGAGICTIAPLSDLPSISDAVTLDGYTQPGATPNTLARTTNAVLKIVLSGFQDGTFNSTGLLLAASDTTIRGLVIDGGFTYGLRPSFAANIHVAGCFVGTDSSGQTASSNGWGLYCDHADNLELGGTAPADRNLISGNSGYGVVLTTCLTPHVLGNLIGTNATGTVAIGNGLPNSPGIDVIESSATVGGAAAGAGNVVSGNGIGISVGQSGPAFTATIVGNLIGTDVTGSLALGNVEAGIDISANGVVVGGVGPGDGNVVANNGLDGIVVRAGFTGATIRGNSVYGNGFGQFGMKLGIDLNLDGVTPNDLCDVDTGSNNLQNFPVISSVVYGASSTTVTGLLNSTANTTFDLDFYSNPACSRFPRDFLQGETYLGSAQVTTDGSCNGPFTVSTLPAVVSGSRISVTATDPSRNTSEFSQRLPFSIDVTSGSPSGGTALTISGTNFLPGATVTIGGSPATGVGVTNYTTMTATTPALAPGSADDLVVTNTDGTKGTLVKAFVADFLDVPNSNQFYSFVTKLVSNAITAGIGGGLYGVNDSTLRQQMAVFLLKAKLGLCYTPPACTPGFFTDVPCPSTFANWIQAMATAGITGGCGDGAYCPQNPVRRDQMAVFLLKAEHGSSYVPPVCTGIFSDVPCPSTFANWIEQLYKENVTSGCGGGMYCPASSNTRGQMAVFIVKTFGLQ
jgi:hypothetical protein